MIMEFLLLTVHWDSSTYHFDQFFKSSLTFSLLACPPLRSLLFAVSIFLKFHYAEEEKRNRMLYSFLTCSPTSMWEHLHTKWLMSSVVCTYGVGVGGTLRSGGSGSHRRHEAAEILSEMVHGSTVEHLLPTT